MSATAEDRRALAKIIADAPKRAVTIDDTLNVFVGVSNAEVEKRIRQALSHGRTVTEKGITRWIENWEVIDGSKEGSAVYTWHKDDERVRCEKWLFTKGEGGTTKTSLGQCWRRIDNV